MTTQLVTLVLTVSIWVFLILGATAQCFVSSETILNVITK